MYIVDYIVYVITFRKLAWVVHIAGRSSKMVANEYMHKYETITYGPFNICSLASEPISCYIHTLQWELLEKRFLAILESKCCLDKPGKQVFLLTLIVNAWRDAFLCTYTYIRLCTHKHLWLWMIWAPNCFCFSKINRAWHRSKISILRFSKHVACRSGKYCNRVFRFADFGGEEGALEKAKQFESLVKTFTAEFQVSNKGIRAELLAGHNLKAKRTVHETLCAMEYHFFQSLSPIMEKRLKEITVTCQIRTYIYIHAKQAPCAGMVNYGKPILSLEHTGHGRYIGLRSVY